MKVNVLTKKSSELRIEIQGEGHTFCNIIQKALLEDEKVDMAGYKILHPLTSNPVIYLRMKGQSRPDVALRNAVNKTQKDTAAFMTAFDKALQE